MDACSDLLLECRDKVFEVDVLRRATSVKLRKYEHSTEEWHSDVDDHKEMILKYKTSTGTINQEIQQALPKMVYSSPISLYCATIYICILFYLEFFVSYFAAILALYTLILIEFVFLYCATVYFCVLFLY